MRLAVAVSFLVLVAVSGGEAFIWPKWGRCPTVTVQQDFDVSRWAGSWYELAGYNTEVYLGEVRCAMANYSRTENKNVLRVQNHAISVRTDKPVLMNGTAQLADPIKDTGVLSVTFDSDTSFEGVFSAKSNYQILGTDYESYSIVYTCKNIFFFFHYERGSLLTRSLNYTQVEIDAYYAATAKKLWQNQLPVYMYESDQTNCHVQRDMH